MKKTTCNNKKAFSVAEAMIALLIGSVALAAASPMITKQIKSQNFTDTQFRIIVDRLETLENAIPKGTVAFFSNDVTPQSTTNPCPHGWAMAPESWKGRFFRMADENNHRETVQEQSIQEHWHDLPSFSLTGISSAQWEPAHSQIVWLSADGYARKNLKYIGTRNPQSAFAGDIFREEDEFIGKGQWIFENQLNNEQPAPSVSNDDETRPKNVSLLVCIKN